MTAPYYQSPIHASSEDPFQDLMVIKEIGQSKVSIFLAQSESAGKFFALKVFPFYKRQIHPNYITETKFNSLNHPNIIKILFCVNKKLIELTPRMRTPISLILMELAPHGDFFDLIITKRISLTEKIVRTYFHQLMKAVEYMHSNAMAHRDIKLENLLVGDDYQLKLADFDSACLCKKAELENSEEIYGTIGYRAPEVLNKTADDFNAVDIYAAGIVLFLMHTGGALPHSENQPLEGVNFFELLNTDKAEFWKKQCEMQKREETFFSEDFKVLFEGMTEYDVEKRIKLNDIKTSNWYQGPVFSNKELETIMRRRFDAI